MKREITKEIIDGLKRIKYSLSPRLFKDNLKLQIQKYEINRDFLEEFIDDLDSADISKYSLTPECINYLIEQNKFDYGAWTQKLKFKNIDILADDEFVKSYSVDLANILPQCFNISSKVFNKYINSNNNEIKKHLLLNYNGPEVTLENILDNLDMLQTDIFKIEKVNNEIKEHNSKVEEYILHTNNLISPLIVLKLMNKIYIPNEVVESIDDLNFIDIDLTENNPDASRIINESQNALSIIFEKYPKEAVEKIISVIGLYAKEILYNADLLKKLLVEFNNFDEHVLMEIYSSFVLTGIRDELLQYAKNYNYEMLAALLVI